MLQFHHTVIYLTIVFFLRVRSRTLCAQWTCHILRTRLSRIPTSRITCHRLVYSYVSFPISRVLLLVRIWIVDSSPVTCSSPFPFWCLLTRLCLMLLLTLTRYVLSTHLETCYSWTLTHLQLIFLLSMFVLVSRRPLYIRLGMGTCSPSSIYFATTLKVQPARSHVLSLVLFSSLAKATALRLLGFILCLLAYR